jgi:hypothetical protein
VEISVNGAALLGRNVLGYCVGHIPVSLFIPPQGGECLGKLRGRAVISDTVEIFFKVHGASYRSQIH